MEKRTEVPFHLYIGCDVEYGFEDRRYNGQLIGYDYRFGWQVSRPNVFVPFHFVKPELITLKLRKLDSMTEEEAVELILVLFNTKQLDEKIDPEEIQIDLAPNDGGLLVAEEMAIVIDVSCRCFEGQIGILHCGSIMLYDDGGTLQALQNIPESFKYLLSKGFDLFDLLPSNLAIDKNK